MRKCRNGLPVTIDREGQRLPRLRAQRPKRPRRECGVGRQESAKAGDQSLSNGPGTPQNLFCGEQKRRPVCLTKRLRGAIVVSVRTAAIAVAVVPNRFLVRRDRRLPLWWAVISYA